MAAWQALAEKCVLPYTLPWTGHHSPEEMYSCATQHVALTYRSEMYGIALIDLRAPLRETETED